MNPIPSTANERAEKPPAEINLKIVLLFAAIVLALMVSALGIIKLATHRLAESKQQRDQLDPEAAMATLQAQRVNFPEPREQPAPRLDLVALKARDHERLNFYGWINRRSNVIHIPIDRAMQLIAQRGLPTRSATNDAATGPSSLQLQQQRPSQSVPTQEGIK